MSAPQQFPPNPQQQPQFPPQQAYPQQMPYGYSPQQGYPQQPQYQQPYGPPRFNFEPGPFVLRFVAWLLDKIFIGLISGIVVGLLWAVGLVTGGLIGDGAGVLAVGFMLWFISVPVFVLVFFVYHIKFETGSGQATPGKSMVGLKIVDQYGGRISAGQSIGRVFAMAFLSSMFFFVGYFLALFTEKKQALHDLLAGTIVIKA